MSRLQLLFAVMVFGAVVATGCASSTQPAIAVNGDEISRSDLNEAMVLLEPPIDAQGNPSNAVGAEFDTDDTVVLDDARSVAVVILIENALLSQHLERLGGAVEPEDRGLATGQAEQFFDGPTIRFKEPARDFIIDTLALRNAMTRLGEVSIQEQIATLASSADIELDPRYGGWEPGFGYLSPRDLLNG